jgi:hypothetical protein
MDTWSGARRRREGARAIARFEAHLDEVRRRVAETGVGDQPVGVVRFDAGGFIGIRVDVDIDKLDAFKSPLWSRLEPVAGDRVHFVGAWNGADLPQLERIVDDIDRALVRPAVS